MEPNQLGPVVRLAPKAGQWWSQRLRPPELSRRIDRRLYGIIEVVRVTIRNRTPQPLSIERVAVATGGKASGRRKMFRRGLIVEPKGFVIVETDPDNVVMQRMRPDYVRAVLVIGASGRETKTRWRSFADLPIAE